MNENIDLTKILDGCPKGTKLYDTLYGEVSFEKIINLEEEYIVVRYGRLPYFVTKDGKSISRPYEECTLLPSKDQQDWSKFERFWDKPKAKKFDAWTFRPYDMVLVRDATTRCWKVDMYGPNINPYIGLITCASGSKPYCIPYNDETEHLVGTNDDCPEYYRWWERKHGTI